MGMVADGNSPSGALWRSIRHEAETALANDPIFGRSLSASILDHSDLGAAVAYQIGQRLGKNANDRVNLRAPPMKHLRRRLTSLRPRAAI